MAGINGVGRFGVRSYVAPASLSSIVTNGLILNLDAGNAASYPGTGTAWTDLSGNGNIATLINGTSYSSSNGGALTFDGINDYVSLAPGLLGTNFTITIWFKTTNSLIEQALYDSKFDFGGVLIEIWNRKINYQVGNSYKLSATTINSNQIYCSTIVKTAGNAGTFYINNVGDGATTATDGNSTNPITLGIYDRGSSTNGYYPFLGNIYQTIIYNRALTTAELTANFDATKSRFGFTSYTTRTAAFATATGITDTTILNALNTFDTGLISNGLDTKMKALYPFVGGTANTHKYNFMDARDTDTAFRLQFNGGWVHSPTGALPNGTNAYADTYLTPSILSQNSNHISYYSRTSAASTGHDAGALDTALTGRFELLLRYSNNMSYNTLMSSIQTGVSVTDGKAYWIMSRTNSSNISQFQNNTKIATSSQPSISPSSFTRSIYWGKSNGQSIWGNKEIALGSIGAGLTDVEASTLYTLTQAFQTSLGRQV